MKKEEIYKILNDIFQDVFDDENIVVNEATTADDIEEWDSLEQIHLVISVEKRFGIKLNLEEAGSFKTVGELAEIIIEKLKG